MKNIVFIGMPGSGKSSVSKKLADYLNIKWIDCDEEIESEEKMSITEIFDLKGEAYFRLKETHIISRVSKLQNVIIATGGGAVLLDENMRMLKSNAVVVYLRRNIENIITTMNSDTRPLLKDHVNKIHDIYAKRYKLYEGYCDIIIDNNRSEEHTLSLLLDALL